MVRGTDRGERSDEDSCASTLIETRRDKRPSDIGRRTPRHPLVIPKPCSAIKKSNKINEILESNRTFLKKETAALKNGRLKKRFYIN
jgi:hypothetical protein